MGDAMEEVKRRMVAMTQSLETKIREINMSVARNDGKTPREQALTRQLAHPAPGPHLSVQILSKGAPVFWSFCA